MRTLVAIPVHNEEKHVRSVLDAVLNQVGNVLVVDDGSSDGTPDILAKYPVDVIRHAVNRGYGRSIRDAFTWAAADGYDWVITMDSDNQHEPEAIPEFLEAASRGDADIISGTRYAMKPVSASIPVSSSGSSGSLFPPPPDRRAINADVTAEINSVLGPALGTTLTDSFCGFKAYRVSALKNLRLDEDGYAQPMQFWVQAAANRLRVKEIPVALIYNDATRTFGGPLDDPAVRRRHYREVFQRELRRCADKLPASALQAVASPCCCR